MSFLPDVIRIAQGAGRAILSYYGSSAGLSSKEDSSPITDADRAAHRFIMERLSALTPDFPIVSEEATPPILSPGATFWLVDPLDGTKEFLKGTGEFTVNIALIKDNAPVLGVVYAPVLDLLYYAECAGGAWKLEKRGDPIPIFVSASPATPLRVVASKDHAGPQVAEMLKRIPNAMCVSMGSSLKFCLVAEGSADIYPRFVPTMEWDTAASQCILREAGGQVFASDGTPLRYNKPDFKNGSLISVGSPNLPWGRYIEGLQSSWCS